MKIELTEEQVARIRGQAEYAIAQIAIFWVKWNKKEITGDEFALKVESLLKPDIDRAWQSSIKKKGIDPLESLLV